jgi:hypothetical protein
VAQFIHEMGSGFTIKLHLTDNNKTYELQTPITTLSVMQNVPKLIEKMLILIEFEFCEFEGKRGQPSSSPNKLQTGFALLGMISKAGSVNKLGHIIVKGKIVNTLTNEIFWKKLSFYDSFSILISEID